MRFLYLCHCHYDFVLQTAPFVMERIFDYPVTPEAKERMSFEERFEGFCVDLIKVLCHCAIQPILYFLSHEHVQ